MNKCHLNQKEWLKNKTISLEPNSINKEMLKVQKVKIVIIDIVDQYHSKHNQM